MLLPFRILGAASKAGSGKLPLHQKSWPAIPLCPPLTLAQYIKLGKHTQGYYLDRWCQWSRSAKLRDLKASNTLSWRKFLRKLGVVSMCFGDEYCKNEYIISSSINIHVLTLCLTIIVEINVRF